MPPQASQHASEEIEALDAALVAVRADIMKPDHFESAPTFINIKSELTSLDLEIKNLENQVKSLVAGAGSGSRPGSSPDGPVGPPGLNVSAHVGEQADFAATSHVGVFLMGSDF